MNLILFNKPPLFAPALHLRPRGLLVDGFWLNEATSKTRYRVGARQNGVLFFRHWIDEPGAAEEFWRDLRERPLPSWLPSPHDYPGLSYEFSTVTFLTTTGSQTYSVPADWNSGNNKVEAVASAGNAAASSGYGGGGGGGGAYAAQTNVSLTPSGTAPYYCGAAGATTKTSFNTSSVVADYGTSASNNTNGTGGLSANCTGALKYSGGDGYVGILLGVGGGGGGAAGPHGAGSVGASPNGGNADNNTVSGGAGNGASGTEWDGSHGCGAGGAGGNSSNGYNGGAYGGAGGGGYYTSTVTAGTSAQGIIVVTYTPIASTFFMPHIGLF